MTTDVPLSTLRRIPLHQLVLDERFRVRVWNERPLGESYRELLLAGVAFPPLEVVEIEATGQLILVDGWHRREALIMIGATEALCAVTAGTESDALLRACSANATNAKQLTISDKRHAVELLLSDPTFNDPQVWSDSAVAQQLGVSPMFVGQIREWKFRDIGQTRQVVRDLKRQERERRVPDVPPEPRHDPLLDHVEAPPGLPPPVPTSTGPHRRNQSASGQPRTRKQSPGRSSRPTAVPPAPLPASQPTLAPMPVGAARAARLKGRRIEITWSELDERASAGMGDWSDMPDDVLAFVLARVNEEWAARSQ